MSDGGFNNPIVGGGGALIYPSIHSPNFRPGPPVVGWSIDKHGNAFFSGTFSGSTYVSNAFGSFFYSGTPATGNLIYSIASTAGNDSAWAGTPGNNYQGGGGTAYDNVGKLFATLIGGDLVFASNAAASRIVGSGEIGLADALTDAAQPQTFIISPGTAIAAPIGVVALFGRSKDSTKPAQVVIAAAANPVPATTAVLEVQGTGQVSGVLSAGAGTNTGLSAPALSPGLVVNTASQLSDKTRDYQIYLTIGTPGTGVTVNIGTSNPPGRTVYGSATPTAGQQITFRLPAGFWMEIAGTGTTLAAQNAIGC